MTDSIEVLEQLPASHPNGLVICATFESSGRSIDREMWLLHEEILSLTMPPGARLLHIAGPFSHAEHIDRLTMSLRNEFESMRANGSEKILSTSVLFLVDLDCVPLDPPAVRGLVTLAQQGELVGNLQSSNHLRNDHHVFIAPSFLAVSLSTLDALDWPSARGTARSDVCEEWTWLAQNAGVPVRGLMPLSHELAPRECDSWRLGRDSGTYGIGTTFGLAGGREVSWHCFQFQSRRETFREWMGEMRGLLRSHNYRSARLPRRKMDRTDFVVSRFKLIRQNLYARKPPA